MGDHSWLCHARNRMKYEQFIEAVETMVREKAKDASQVRLTKVSKNNALELQGICISTDGDAMSPIIYLHDFYERYQRGEDLEQITDCILTLSREHKKSHGMEVFFEFEQMKDKIFYRLVHFEKNETMLKSMPHIRYLDLAITFHCLVRQEDEEIGTLRITNEHLRYWNINSDTLLALASQNTPNLFPCLIRTMGEVISEMLPDSEGECVCPTPMYVLTNTSGINGATVILYQDVLQRLSRTLESDFYILPSSVHEVIAVPVTNGFAKQELSAMVEEINNSQVAPEEVLSGQVYRYQRTEQAIRF